MKHNYFISLLLLIHLLAFSKETPPPSATISGSATVCQNSPNPVITFTGSGGATPYTFTYHIGLGPTQTVTTTGSNSSITVSAGTGTAGSFVYHLDSVHDATLPTTEESISGQSATITVNPQADAALNSSATAATFNGFPIFKVCSNQITQIDFYNVSSTIPTNTSYTISWGDATPNFTSSSWNTVSHNYAVGLWTLVYNITAANGCNISKTFKIFVGNNPAVGLGNPGNTDVCISSPLTFPITGTENNPPGTTYTVSFNDGSSPITFNHPPPTEVTHTFLISSCGINSTVGTTYQNSFYASIVATNPCDQSSATVVPIRISTPPIANFTLPQTITCTNAPVCLVSTTTGGDDASSSVCSSPKLIWTISPNSGFTLSSGALGNDLGSVSTNPWQSGSPSICPVFSIPGNYTITLKVGNRCGINSITKTICVEAPLVPQFTLSTNSGCVPLAVTATNTTNLTNQCSTPTYNWTVTYTAANCGSTSGYSYTNATTASSASPSFNFTEAGTYSVMVTMTNSCGSAASPAQIITVKKPPTVSLNTISDFCQNVNLTPVANINTCTSVPASVTYLWSFPGGTPATAGTAVPPSVTYATAGNHTVSLTVTNECGSATATSNSFSVQASPFVQNAALTVCSGAAFTFTPSNSTSGNSIPAGTTYSWNVPSVTGGMTGGSAGLNQSSISGTITNNTTALQTATYTITPKVGGCSGTPFILVVSVNPAASITTQPVSSSVCLNGTPAILSISLSNVVVTPTYQWYQNTSNSIIGATPVAGATASSYTPPAGSVGTLYYYCIVSLSSGGCSSITSTIASVTVAPIATITTQPIPTQTICVGGSSNALTVSYSGGVGTPTYQWFSNSTNSTTGGTPVGINSASYTAPVFAAPGSYYYYVQVSLNGNGCGSVSSNTAEVVVVADPVVTAQPLAAQTQCQNSTATTLTVAATGGTGTLNYQWYSVPTNTNTGGTAIVGANSAGYTPPTPTVGTFYYYCQITQSASGCSVNSAVATLTVVPAPQITTQPQSSTVCLNGTPTTLSVAYSNGTGTATYQWYDASGPIAGATSATFTPTAAIVGSNDYYCIVAFSEGGCSGITSNTATVVVNPLPIVDLQPLPTQSICVGGSVLPLSVGYTGGVGTASYQWYSNTSNSTTGGTPVGGDASSYTPPVFNTPGSYYYYAVISLTGNGCGSTTSAAAEVVVVADPIVTAQPLATQTVCQNAISADLTLSASGGVGSSYNYQWYSSPTNDTSSGTPIAGENNAVFTPPTATAGTVYYYCEVSQAPDVACSVLSAIAQVNVNLAPAIDNQPVSSTVCVNQAATLLSVTYLNGAGTPDYQWFQNSVASNLGGTAIPGATASTYTASTNISGVSYYYCHISFASLSGGCEVITSDVATVTVNDNPVISDVALTICSATAFNVSPDSTGGNIVPSGTTYTWPDPVVSPAGSVTGSFPESVPQTGISQTLINTTTSPATVTYLITPLSGVCQGQNFTIVVTVNPAINPNVVLTNNTCYGVNTASITTDVTGGIPNPSGNPYDFSWTGPNGFSSNASTILNLEPGSYDLTISDSGGCPFTHTYIITEPTDIALSADNETDISCYGSNDGSISIAVSGGTGSYSYTWTQNGVFYSSAEDISGLAPGTYVVSVTDANSCGPKSATFTITEPTLLVATLVSQTNVLCYGDSTGAISVNVSGGTPGAGYAFSWTGPGGFSATSQDLTAIPAGDYLLTVTDSNGCTKELSVTITQSSPIVIDYTTTPITCYGANNASISVTLSGGNAPYQYQWSNLATALSQTDLAAGDYIITVTDNVGCIKIQTINIPEAPVFMVNPVVANISCYGAHDGSINLNLTGGIAPVALSWSDGSTSGLVRNNLGPGTYIATISDGTPCYIVRSFTIVEPSPMVLSANVTDALGCTNANSGAINLTVAGGTPPYTYSWSNNATTEDLAGVTSGNYLVNVTDANACTKSAQFAIVRPDPIAIAVDTQTDFDCTTHTVSQNFIASVSGGVPPYHLQWSSGTVSGNNNQIMHSDVNGTVLLTVTDNIGCVANYTVTVDNPVLGYTDFEPTSFGYTSYGIYSIGDPIQFNSTITGDYVSVIWDFGDGTFSNEVNPTHIYVNPRDYVVTQTVTYPFGCVYVQTISLIIEQGYLMIVPNAFTPNNDSLNDHFHPFTKRLKNVQLDVYDTWGSLIYSEKGDVLVGWDGKIKGSEAENGNYYCKVIGETFYGTTVKENHPFVLIK